MLRRENRFVLNCGIVIRNVGVTRRERSHHHSPTPSGSGRGCYANTADARGLWLHLLLQPDALSFDNVVVVVPKRTHAKTCLGACGRTLVKSTRDF